MGRMYVSLRRLFRQLYVVQLYALETSLSLYTLASILPRQQQRSTLERNGEALRGTDAGVPLMTYPILSSS
jgi:hypothetical protein